MLALSNVLRWLNGKRAYIIFSEQRKYYQEVHFASIAFCISRHNSITECNYSFLVHERHPLWEGTGWTGLIQPEKRQLWGAKSSATAHEKGVAVAEPISCCCVVMCLRDRMQGLKQERKSFLLLGSRAGYQRYWVLNYYIKIKTESFVLQFFSIAVVVGKCPEQNKNRASRWDTFWEPVHIFFQLRVTLRHSF